MMRARARARVCVCVCVCEQEIHSAIIFLFADDTSNVILQMSHWNINNIWWEIGYAIYSLCIIRETNYFIYYAIINIIYLMY